MAATVAGGRDGPLQFLEARLLLASFLAMGVMTFSLVLYGEDLHATGTEGGLEAVRNIGRLLLALFALPVLALLVPPLATGAWADLRRGVVRMDGLVVIATVAAYALSLHATWAGGGQVYYETATMVLVLVTFGRRLEAHARSEGRDAAALLAEWLPETACRLEPGGEQQVAPGELVAGDVCRVAPGALLPADVIVLEGRSEVVCAHVTGEQAPRRAEAGDRLPAGATNGHGALVARVERPLAEGTLAVIKQLLDAPLSATHAMRTADRWAGRLTAIAIALALGGGLLALRSGGVGPALRTALSVLLVACPCALGLATPLAYRALRVALARRGLLVRDAAQLERVARVDHVIFDKTGTLTRPLGAPRVLWGSPAAASDLARLVRASGHALAACFEPPAGDGPVGDVLLVPGRGVEGHVRGTPCRAGSAAWIAETCGEWPPEAPDREASARAGHVVFEQAGRLVAVVALEQHLRPEAAMALEEMRELGCTLEVLSGDRGEALTDVASQLGVPVYGGLSPEDKLAWVREARARGRVVMLVGDGLNDAPALREADVGVAMGTGTGATRAHAGIELMGDDLSDLPSLLRAGRRLSRTVTGNLTWSVAYNGVALALATAGQLHPLVAASAMIASSVVVSLRCHRLLGWVDPARAPPAARGTATPPSAGAPTPGAAPGSTAPAAPASTPAPPAARPATVVASAQAPAS